MQKILVTGANGFIAKNLIVGLNQLKNVEVLKFTHDMTRKELEVLVNQADFVFHLAGVNRPLMIEEFKSGNEDLTIYLCKCIQASKRKIPVVFSSSIQATLSNDYAKSKLSAEQTLSELNRINNTPLVIYRLPNVFGKWCRPNYNSVVATFCYNISHGLDIRIDEVTKVLALVYIDDVVNHFIELLGGLGTEVYRTITPVYEITLGELAELLYKFKNSSGVVQTLQESNGLYRALYSTFISYT